MGRRILLAIALLAISTPSIAAVLCTWTGAGTDGNWSTAANWNNCGGAHALPVDGDNLVFPSGAQHLVNNNDLVKLHVTNLQLNGLNYDISGNPIALALGINSATPGAAGGDLPPIFAPNISLETNSQTFGCSSGAGFTLTGVISLHGLGLTSNANCAIDINGNITGAGTLTKLGSHNLSLGGLASTYTGPTTIDSGLILALADNALGATGLGNETIVHDGGTLFLDGGVAIGEDLNLAGAGFVFPGFFFGALLGGTGTVNGDITLSADTMISTVDQDSDLTLAGNIDGNFELTMQGDGTVHWLGVGQTPSTNVAAGTLELAGSTLAVLVANSGTLSGEGTCTDTTIDPTGTLAPGPLATSRPGTLTMANLTWTAGAAFAFQLGSTSAASDQAAVKGNLSSSSTGAFQFQFSDAASPPVPGVAYTVISFSQLTGFSLSDFSFLYTGTGPGSSMTGSFALTATALQFTPSTVVSDLVFRADLGG